MTTRWGAQVRVMVVGPRAARTRARTIRWRTRRSGSRTRGRRPVDVVAFHPLLWLWPSTIQNGRSVAVHPDGQGGPTLVEHGTGRRRVGRRRRTGARPAVRGSAAPPAAEPSSGHPRRGRCTGSRAGGEGVGPRAEGDPLGGVAAAPDGEAPVGQGARRRPASPRCPRGARPRPPGRRSSGPGWLAGVVTGDTPGIPTSASATGSVLVPLDR